MYHLMDNQLRPLFRQTAPLAVRAFVIVYLVMSQMRGLPRAIALAMTFAVGF
jgi:hypothetical protein